LDYCVFINLSYFSVYKNTTFSEFKQIFLLLFLLLNRYCIAAIPTKNINKHLVELVFAKRKNKLLLLD